MAKINWDEIQKIYVTSEKYTLSELAKEYGVSVTSIKRHSAEGKWAKKRRAHIERIKKEIAKEQEHLAQQKKVNDFTYREKVNLIADKLLLRIEECAIIVNKPSGIQSLTTALKDLVNIYRDVNEEPTIAEQRQFEIAKERLDIERKKSKIGSNVEENTGGVVILPEVKADE